LFHWLYKVFVLNILTCQYSRLHNAYLCFYSIFMYWISYWPMFTSFFDPLQAKKINSKFFLKENRSKSSSSFQVLVKPTFISIIKIYVMKFTPMTYVHHLPHIYGISSHCFGVTSQASLITFSHTSYYKSVSRKIMNFPHEYSSKFEVWLPSLVDTLYVVTHVHNSCKSSIKGAYMSPYLHLSLILFQGLWSPTW
jgi:hypothetical protein